MASRLSACSGNRLRLILALVATSGVVAAGCGSPGESARVAGYIQRVNQVEVKLARPLDSVSRIATAFVGQPPIVLSRRSAAQARAMRADVARLRRAVHELAALPAPAPAGHLRALLLGLARSQLQLARELSRLVAVAPRFYGALGRLGPATVTLERVLLQNQAYGSAAVAGVFAAKEVALRRFQATTRSILAGLRPLAPPAVLRPSFVAARASLQGMGTSAGQLATALETGTSASAAVAAFDRAAAGESSAVVRRAQAAAARAYNTQRARLTALAESIAREEARLQRKLR